MLRWREKVLHFFCAWRRCLTSHQAFVSLTRLILALKITVFSSKVSAAGLKHHKRAILGCFFCLPFQEALLSNLNYKAIASPAQSVVPPSSGASFPLGSVAKSYGAHHNCCWTLIVQIGYFDFASSSSWAHAGYYPLNFIFTTLRERLSFF